MWNTCGCLRAFFFFLATSAAYGSSWTRAGIPATAAAGTATESTPPPEHPPLPTVVATPGSYFY